MKEKERERKKKSLFCERQALGLREGAASYSCVPKWFDNGRREGGGRLGLKCDEGVEMGKREAANADWGGRTKTSQSVHQPNVPIKAVSWERRLQRFSFSLKW